MILGYMARDQYGQTYHLPDTKHPRKALLEKLHGSNASKMYIDTKQGKAKHIGWMINRLWLTVYEVHEWQGKE